MNKIECFKIQLFTIENGKRQSILQIKNDKHTLFSEPTVIVADPFLFVHDGYLYLFYEQKKLRHNGTIMMMRTDDLEHWSKPVEVLREPFHLSYPWVFEKDGHIYMMPETCGDKSVRLYEAVDPNLTDFRLVKKLIEQDDDDLDFSFSDSSVVERDGMYYLFTTVRKGGVNQLRLFCSNEFMGEYHEHPKSPICVSNKYGRNAGHFTEHHSELYRFAQDCEKGYGDNVHVLKVKKLSADEYQEYVVKENILDRNNVFYKFGGHQLNIAGFKGKIVIATDAKEYHRFLVNRALNKIFV